MMLVGIEIGSYPFNALNFQVIQVRFLQKRHILVGIVGIDAPGKHRCRLT